jgi:hypothetical protein
MLVVDVQIDRTFRDYLASPESLHLHCAASASNFFIAKFLNPHHSRMYETFVAELRVHATEIALFPGFEDVAQFSSRFGDAHGLHDFEDTRLVGVRVRGMDEWWCPRQDQLKSAYCRIGGSCDI